MSAFTRPTALRTVVRQFAVATALCAAVAVPAVLSGGGDSATAPVASTNSTDDNVWPSPPSPAPVAPVN